jgi:hypothetical protein
MENLFSVIGATFAFTVILCWLLTSNWMLNPAIGIVIFIVSVLWIGSWGMSMVETDSHVNLSDKDK